MLVLMLPKDLEMEIEKLKTKKIELTNKLNITTDYDEKESIKEAVEELQKQIDVLEKLKV